MPLTAIQIKSLKPTPGKRFTRYFDSKGLYVQVSASGSKYWRMKYRFDAKEKLLSIGTYPELSLADARAARDEARSLVAKGIDPSAKKQADKSARAEANENSFEPIAREWLAKQNWSESHAVRNARRLEAHIFPMLGRTPVLEITAADILPCLRRIEERGHLETAHRVRALCSQVFRYAVATQRASRDPAADLIGAIAQPKERHHASITRPSEIGALMRAIEDYAGQITTKLALRLIALTFVRPGELRHAEWEEFNFDDAEWRIPAEKMKARAPHIVPLSPQAISTLEELRPLTGHKKYLFPSLQTASRPMSENTLNTALRRMGYGKDEMTAHGFRSMASTILNEQQKWHPDAIERQLAHTERNRVRAAYNYAEHLPERRVMMEEWGRFLGGVRDG